MKKIAFALLSVLNAVMLHAQTKDSLESKNKVVEKIIVSQFPSARFIDVQYEQLTGTDYKTKLHGQHYETGTVETEERIQVAVNRAIIKKKDWALSTSLRYRYRNMRFGNIDVPSGGTPIIGKEGTQQFHYFLGSLNYTRYDKLFKKTLVSNLSVFGDGSHEAFGIVNATYIATLLLRKDDATTLAVGLVLQTNPNSIFPVLPAFSYSHQFGTSPWQVDIILPKQIYFRRSIQQRGRLSMGTVFEGEPFYFNTNLDGTGNVLYNFNRNEIKSGLMYEHKIGNNFIASCRAGYNMFLNGTIRERGETKEISQTTFDPNFYGNVGLSYNLTK